MIEWGVAGRALYSAAGSGDAYLVKDLAESALLAVADGLGHGPEAAEAARAALGLIDTHARESPLTVLHQCHRLLRTTRGAAVSMAAFASGGVLTWLGVGNVAGFLLRQVDGRPSWDELPLHRGVVGYKGAEPLVITEMLVRPGDTLVMTTDGIRWHPDEGSVIADVPPQAAAKQLLRRHGTGNDDALALVARYRGDAQDE